MATEDEAPKKSSSKRSTSRKKKDIPVDLNSAELNEVVSKPVKKILKNDLIIEELIKQAFLRFSDNVSIKQSKVKDLEHLDTIAEEYLKTYMILGYDLNGEKVSIMHAKNPHDRDALVEHLRTTLLDIIRD
jgi:type II secretory pathway component GspD/PulD (secretin)